MNERLLFVVGKGGVGRTSVATALALAAGNAGKRAAVIEINGLSDIGRRFDKERSYLPCSIAENVDWMSLSPEDCLDDFGRRKLRLGIVGGAVFSSRPFRAFVDAIPGVADLLQLGKIENLLNDPRPDETRYDLVVVDAPATGHGLTLLGSAQSMKEVSGSGPFHELARIIGDALSHDSTGLVVVSLPEELPLQETEELLAALEAGPADPVLLVTNRVVPPPFPASPPWSRVREALVGEVDLVRLQELGDLALAAYVHQQTVLDRMAAHGARLGVPVAQVPRCEPMDAGRMALALEGL